MPWLFLIGGAGLLYFLVRKRTVALPSFVQLPTTSVPELVPIPAADTHGPGYTIITKDQRNYAASTPTDALAVARRLVAEGAVYADIYSNARGYVGMMQASGWGMDPEAHW